MEELLVLFIGVILPARRAPTASLFVVLAPLGLLKDWPWGQPPFPLMARETGKVSCFANYTTCPALLAPRHEAGAVSNPGRCAMPTTTSKTKLARGSESWAVKMARKHLPGYEKKVRPLHDALED